LERRRTPRSVDPRAAVAATLDSFACIELAVDERMQQPFAFGAVHGTDPGIAPGKEPSATFQAERSIERARASRAGLGKEATVSAVRFRSTRR